MEAVSVIMPTRARRERRALFRRALASVLAQENVRVVPLVVINGPERDFELTEELRADPRLRVMMLDQADLPAALAAGRKMVDTNWFAELDDDDVLLPGALAVRLEALQKQPELAAVITNGVKRTAAGDTLNINDVSSVQRDPLRSLFRSNWLLPGSWLCRTDRVGVEFFQGMPKFLECTYLALRLALDRRIGFLDCPTIVYYAETPNSESGSRDYQLSHVGALRRLLDLELPADIKAELRKRIRNGCQENGLLYLDEGRLNEAWRWHLQSFRGCGGWRSIRHTPRFLYHALRGAAGERRAHEP
jgi:glycosyltransferase involved in cell wall biosynthesis